MFEELYEWLSDWISEVVDWFKCIFREILGRIKSIWQGVRDRVKKLVEKGKKVFFVKSRAGKCGKSIVELLNGAGEVSIGEMEGTYQQVTANELDEIESIIDIKADPAEYDMMDRMLAENDGLIRLVN